MAEHALTWLAASRERAQRSGLDYVRLTEPQRIVAQDAAQRVIWRDGNQLGKSYFLAWEILHRLRGTHPYKTTHRPPIRALVASVSLEQMMPLMEKLWELAPKDELSHKCGFDPGRGLTGKPPRLVFTSGPGKGSVLSFATYKQGTTRIAGGTYHLVGLDEPPTEQMWGEVQPRLMRQNGDLICTFTPTPDMPDLGWLREMVEAEAVEEHNFGLTEANCWIAGAPRPFKTQEEIDEYAATLLEHERAMRIDGAWEPLTKGAWLTNFSEKNTRSDRPLDGAYLGVGIDHGAAAGKQAAVLFAAMDRHGRQPRVWWWDETLSDGLTTPAQDAQAILDMLARNGLTMLDVDEWVGDRPTGESKHHIRKSNKALRIQLCHIAGIPLHRARVIHTPHKWGGSLTYGMRMLNGLFGTVDDDGIPIATVHPRCKRFIAFALNFKGDRRDPLKDVGDAGRYIMERTIKVRGWRAFKAIQ